MTAELSACPFCGGEAKVHHCIDQAWVQCEHCDTSGRYGTTESEAIELWNHRITDTQHKGVPDTFSLLQTQCDNYRLMYEQTQDLLQHYQDVLANKDRLQKLEELCRQLYECAQTGKCAYCEHYDGQHEQCDLRLEQRMRVLGLLEDE